MNQNIKPKIQGTKALFRNPLLERLTRTNVAVPISLFCFLSIVSVYYVMSEVGSPPMATASLFMAGFLFFTLVEYLAHRYFFHMKDDTEIKAKVQYAVHGRHHEYPKDKDRLAMPPLLALVYATVFYLIFSFLIGDYVFAFLPGVMVGYSFYLFVHFNVHARQPPKNFLKILWVHHGIHHYKDHTVAFGVSSPLWDYVFRTMPKQK